MKKLFSVVLLMICINFQVNISVEANADINNEKVEPNIYEQKDIQLEQKNRDKDKQVKELPREQHDLSFEQINPSTEELVNELFQAPATEKNTIKSMADNLQLFVKIDEKPKVEVEQNLLSKRLNLFKYAITFVIVILGGILMFIFPRFVR